MMAFFTRIVLDAPDRWTQEHSAKRCYEAFLEVYDYNNNFKFAFYPSAVVSMTNRIVITAYPPSNSNCWRNEAWA